MVHQVTLIPVDGVGPVLAEVTRECIDATERMNNLMNQTAEA